MQTIWLMLWLGFVVAMAIYFVVAAVLYWRDVRHHR